MYEVNHDDWSDDQTTNDVLVKDLPESLVQSVLNTFLSPGDSQQMSTDSAKNPSKKSRSQHKSTHSKSSMRSKRLKDLVGLFLQKTIMHLIASHNGQIQTKTNSFVTGKET